MHIPRLSPLFVSLALPAALLTPAVSAQGSGANYKLAERFSDDFIKQYVHSASVRPNWIGETDKFWYHFKTRSGHHYWLVDCEARRKEPLFDHDDLAAQLSLALHTPVDAPQVELGGAKLDDAGRVLSFTFQKHTFEFDRLTRTLVDKGAAPRPTGPTPEQITEMLRRGIRPPTPERQKTPWQHRSFSPDKTCYLFAMGHDLYLVEAPPKVRKVVEAVTARMEKEKKAKEEAKKAGKTVEEKKERDEKKKDTDKKTDDKKQETVKKTDEKKTDTKGGDKKTGDEKDDDKKKPKIKDTRDEREKWADKVDEAKARRLSTDGVEHYSFAQRGFRRNLEEEKKPDPKEKHPVRATWSKDSSVFAIQRSDSRGVKELFLVDSLAKPRPKLERYQYAMPGEEHIARSDLFYYHRTGKRQLTKVPDGFMQESFLSVHFKPETSELRFVRQDRPRRSVELVAIDPATGEQRVLLADTYEVGLINTQPVRYLEKRKEMLWWSERSGWGHYYLYDIDGKLKNPVTRGTFRANRIVEVDEDKGTLYFQGSGRERDGKTGARENLYFQHLYRVFLDGSALTLLDPGDANHTSSLSKSKSYVVDNYDRVDVPPRSVLRDATGKHLMDLQEMDVSALYDIGWRPPETFVVKAADGVTDLFGNMWKPFDFDPEKKYPIILHVYPGPQQEGVTHTFSATGSGRQQLAQLGFIVVQVGHRGGAPGRSKAYQNFSYWNMRDYALEDKKVAVEKLAARHPFIDIDRVGIYGHSGGGFFTATAMLKPPYNKFFKVGVSSAGNHDNNIYNNSWSERYHGLKEVEVKEKKGTEKKGTDKKETEKKDDRMTRRKRIVAAEDSEDEKQDKEKKKTRFEIHIPTTWELAKNLEGHLLLVHGDMDNNVHPAGTVRLVDALIKANKRFDMLFIPGARHGFGAARGYFEQRMWEYFAQHLLGDYQPGADITEKAARHR